MNWLISLLITRKYSEELISIAVRIELEGTIVLYLLCVQL
jgi:hypothetical protein